MKAQSRSLNGCTVIMIPATQTTMANFIAPMTMKIIGHQQEAKVLPPKQNHYGKAKKQGKSVCQTSKALRLFASNLGRDRVLVSVGLKRHFTVQGNVSLIRFRDFTNVNTTLFGDHFG